jgi:2-dehydro-3-deoxyphosphogluconate aldolase/(4S)-4-hydroxy-2-oxoglutarate aldolase
MSRWRPTSDPNALIASLRRQPLLLVLRPESPSHASPLLASLQDFGFVHVELAWRSGSRWVGECRQLKDQFPLLRLGAASLCSAAALEGAAAAGLSYGVSPILDAAMVRLAAQLQFTLVPGVFSPTEVDRARRWGCPIVKLFPAASLGPGYWRRLRQPLGEPLPFCIAAGGLQIDDVLAWLAAGVDAVALGSSLITPPTPLASGLDPAQIVRLRTLIATLVP